MRTGEVDALMWGDIDITNKTLTVQRSLRKGELSGLKTEGSHRAINLIDRVVDILIKHKKSVNLADNFVFTNSKRKPLNYHVVSRSVWYPALLKAKLRPRNPYQTRHTFATLLLASGETPEWIANQMDHNDYDVISCVFSICPKSHSP